MVDFKLKGPSAPDPGFPQVTSRTEPKRRSSGRLYGRRTSAEVGSVVVFDGSVVLIRVSWLHVGGRSFGADHDGVESTRGCYEVNHRIASLMS